MDRTVLQGAFAVSMLGSECPSRRGLASKPAPLPFPLLDHWIPEVERDIQETGIHSTHQRRGRTTNIS